MNQVKLSFEFADGSTAAFDDIYAKCHDKLYYYAKRMVDDIVVNDIVQECFVKVWNRRDRYDSEQHLINSLMAISRNQCIDWCKKKRFDAARAKDIAVHLEKLHQEALYFTDLSAAIMDHFEKHLLDLAQVDRHILRYYLIGYSNKEIGDLVSMNPKTVANRLSMAKAKLAENVVPSDLVVAMVILIVMEAHWLSAAAPAHQAL